jgi:peptidoglycan hydrolase CwlO-like protein
MKKLVLIAAALALSVPAFAQAPQKDQLPTGKQYLTGQLAAAEAKVSDMLDEIAMLRKQIEMLMTKREEPKK